MRICLDTSAYSAFKRGLEGAVEAVARARKVVVSPIVLGELDAGFRQGDRLERNRSELRDFLRSSRVLAVGIDHDTARRYSEIHSFLRRQGTPIPTNDIWIAASAMQFGLEVLTGDRHFLHVPQVITRLLTTP